MHSKRCRFSWWNLLQKTSKFGSVNGNSPPTKLIPDIWLYRLIYIYASASWLHVLLGRSSDWHCYAFFSRVHMTIFIIHENMRQKQNTRFHVPTHLGETRPKTPETDQWLAANQPPLHWHSLGNPRLEEKTASNLWRNINPQKKKKHPQEGRGHKSHWSLHTKFLPPRWRRPLPILVQDPCCGSLGTWLIHWSNGDLRDPIWYFTQLVAGFHFTFSGDVYTWLPKLEP